MQRDCLVTKRPGKSSPSWTDVKDKMTAFDRASLVGLVQDLYAASKDNQAFLHARLRLGEAVLEPYFHAAGQFSHFIGGRRAAGAG